MSATEELIAAALRLAALAERNTDDRDEWQHAIDSVRELCARQAARHMEKLQAAVDAVQSPWRPMKDAPKDGWAIMVLLDGSDVPHAVRWLRGKDDPHATEETEGPGWHMTWDGTPVAEHDGPRYWMECPTDPDAA